METRCCVCQVKLKDNGIDDGKISHSYCPEHYKKAMDEVRKDKKLKGEKLNEV